VKRLGALGTMVWDTIHARDAVGGRPVEEWGGICYGFSAFEAAAPDGWELLPIVKVGANLRERANAYLRDLSRVGSLDGVLTVPEANNEVEIFYGDRARRCERLTGGVPGWTWEELEPLARTWRTIEARSTAICTRYSSVWGRVECASRDRSMSGASGFAVSIWSRSTRTS
jgi:hypothetical protein